MRESKAVGVTDTTFRDAHQSLLATRLRTTGLLMVAPFWAGVAVLIWALTACTPQPQVNCYDAETGESVACSLIVEVME